MNRTLFSLMFVGLVASSGIYANVNPDGSFSQSIPIKLPPAKLTPEISLEYNSHAGNGMLGVGWQLSGIPFIKRVNYTSAISYTTNADTFAASDDGILVLQGTGDYFSKAESFTKYTPVGSCNGPCSWVAKTRSGLTLYFGNTTDSYIDAVGKNAARVWALSKVEDRNGNGYEVSYEKDTQNGDYYPALIRSYGPGVSTYDTVEFVTNTIRNDQFSSYADGALERMDRVLTGITVKRGGTQIRQYDLSYANGTSTGRSRLTSVQESGTSGSSTLLTQEFSWQDGTTHLQPPLTAWGTGFAQDGNQQLGDFNGDGKTDILRFRSDGSVDVWVSSGSGFPTMVSWGTGFAQDGNQQLGDFNGDGKTDILRFRSDGSVDVWVSSGSGFPTMVSWGTGFAQDGNQQLGDFNGDGKTDILRFRSDGSVDVWVSSGSGFPTMVSWGTGFAQDGNQQLGDFNGDGKTDILRFRSDGSVDVWVSSGSGFPTMVSWGTGFAQDANQRLADFNGDGKTDVLRFRSNGAACVMLSTGLRFSEETTWETGFAQDEHQQLADYNGDGRVDILRFRSTGSVDVWASTGPGDLLISSTNGLGSTTTITYTPATQVPNAVRADLTSPGIANASPRPLVTSVSTTDGRALPGLPQGNTFTSNYAYDNGRFIPGTADVAADLGFATFTATNANSGMYQVTAFHQTQPCQGMPHTSESHASGGALISKVDSLYGSVSPHVGTTLVLLTSEKNSAYNLGTTPSFSRTKAITYDNYGNQTIVTESGGGAPSLKTETSYKTDTNWDLDKPLQITVTSGGTTLKQKTLTYSGANVTRSCDWIDDSHSSCTDFGHDTSGNIDSITDPFGNITTMTYDLKSAQVASITNALGHVVSKSYNDDGTVSAETDANGNVTSYSYDAFGRLLQTNFANGGRVTENTVSLGNPNAQYKQITTLTDGNRSTEKTQYFDGLGFVYKETTKGDSGTIQVLKTKDGAGRIYSTSQPHYSAGGSADWTTNDAFDPAGRVTSTTLAGITTTISYGTDSTTTTVSGKSETKTYDALGKIASITDAMSNTTSYSYDALGRVTSVTLPDSSVTTIAYNGLGLKTSITEPNTGTTTFAYDAAGRLTSQTNARGQVVTLTRDVLGRVTEKSFSGGSGTSVTYNYDESGFSNGIGRLTSKTDAGGETQYSYDSMGQIQTKHMVVDGKSYSYTTAYDFAKRPTAITYPEGSVVEYSYTDGGNLSTMGLQGGQNPYATWTGYNAQGNPGKVEYGNDTETDFTYGTLGKLSTLVTEGPNGQLQNLSYTFENALGTNVTAIADNRSSKINPNTSENTDETVSYTYDNLDRMTQANGVWGTLSYAYNSVGNMTSMEGRSLTYTGQRATSGTDFTATYDASGNNTAQTIDSVSWSYDYDAENRMTRVQKGGNVVANMVYDDVGQRVKKTFNRPDSGQVTTIYIGQGYEVRKRDGIEFHTINLHGNGHLVASITQQGTILTSMGEFNKQLALANLFSSKSILGLISKGAQYFAAAMSHPMATTVIGYAFMILLIGGMLFSFLFSFAKERGWIGQPSEERPVFGMRLRLATLGIAMIFSLTSCGSNGPGGGGLRFWPFGSGIYHVPLTNALTGDTLNGLPLGTYFYHKNQINSSSVITNGVGEEASRIIYKPFGTIDHDHSPGINSVTHKFTGQELDEESGLYYYNARYYNPAIGRFVSADSVVPGNGEDPQGFNRYAYVRNNPVKYTDPTGHFWNILAAMMGGVAWAAAGIAGGAAWAAAGAAGGVAWAAAGASGAIRAAGTNIGNGAKEIATGGAHSRHRGNDLTRGWDSTIGNGGIGGWLGERLSVKGPLRQLAKNDDVRHMRHEKTNQEMLESSIQQSIVLEFLDATSHTRPPNYNRAFVSGFLSGVKDIVISDLQINFVISKYGDRIDSNLFSLDSVSPLGPVYSLYRVYSDYKRNEGEAKKSAENYQKKVTTNTGRHRSSGIGFHDFNEWKIEYGNA